MRLDSINLSPEVTLLLAVVVGIVGSARIVRLVTGDKFPPSIWLRIKWDTITHDGQWSNLMSCPWCLAPYVVAANLTAGWLSNLHPAWWITNTIAAGAYATSWIVFHDED